MSKTAITEKEEFLVQEIVTNCEIERPVELKKITAPDMNMWKTAVKLEEDVESIPEKLKIPWHLVPDWPGARGKAANAEVMMNIGWSKWIQMSKKELKLLYSNPPDLSRQAVLNTPSRLVTFIVAHQLRVDLARPV